MTVNSELNEIERLQWQCRRGMLELDELFNQFLRSGYQGLEEQEKSLFSEFLGEPDPDLYKWLLIGGPCPTQYKSLIVKIKGSQ